MTCKNKVISNKFKETLIVSSHTLEVHKIKNVTHNLSNLLGFITRIKHNFTNMMLWKHT